MPIEVTRPKKEDILSCVARFDEIAAANTGLPDQEIEGYYRTFRNAIGFKQPEGSETYSPIGDAARPKISHLKPGFGMAYVSAEPGQGVLMHTHDTNETFVVMEGTWKFEWEGEDGNEHVILEERDIVSFPPGPHRRFECMAAREGHKEGMILGVIGGDEPGAEFSKESVELMKAAGTWPEAAE